MAPPLLKRLIAGKKNNSTKAAADDQTEKKTKSTATPAEVPSANVPAVSRRSSLPFTAIANLEVYIKVQQNFDTKVVVELNHMDVSTSTDDIDDDSLDAADETCKTDKSSTDDSGDIREKDNEVEQGQFTSHSAAEHAEEVEPTQEGDNNSIEEEAKDGGIENEEPQQQKDIPATPCLTGSPKMKRRVSFSDFCKIISSKNREQMAEAEQQNDEAEGGEGQSEQVLRPLDNPFAAEVNELDCVENGKELIAAPVMDRTRIVGQRAADDDEWASDNDGWQDADIGGAVEEYTATNSGAVSEGLSSSPLFSAHQADQFVRTHRFFEFNGRDKSSGN